MVGVAFLTTPPTNVKEAIDWLALVGGGWGGKSWEGTGKPEKLAKALKKLNHFKDFTACCKMHVTRDSLSDIIYIFAQGLGYGFLGYNGHNSSKLNGKGIVTSDVEYQSAYRNCNWSSDGEPDYAKTFLFLAPLAFYFITFLYWMCKDKSRWADKMLSDSGSLYKFFEAMGYDQSQLNPKKQGSQIADRLGGYAGFPELNEAYDTGGSTSYGAFLSTLETNGPKTPLFRPLTNCMRFSYAYLQSKQNASDITDAIDAIKEELKELNASSDISSTENFSDLKQKMKTLLGKIPGFNLNPGSSEPGSDGTRKPGSSGTISASQVQSSSAGPAVGGPLGVGTLGAGAAYGLNLGGLQTTINGLLHLR
ncbi:variant erythrocyte surface antigen-1 family protein [Babesia caballi]|uniref:Variant erythrocyte surface antigen-1 family protein n=1 Tax=Babesia caballi TaxID=5871 RepID=A0AAV4LV52_BABCB|nr:variant erythrocyte surface antigen-1 family protein [Babesia caballi]